MYALNNKAAKCEAKLIELKGKIEKSTIRETSTSPLSTIDRPAIFFKCQQKYVRTQQNLIDIYKIIHPTLAEYALSYSSHTKIENICVHKANPN